MAYACQTDYLDRTAVSAGMDVFDGGLVETSPDPQSRVSGFRLRRVVARWRQVNRDADDFKPLVQRRDSPCVVCEVR